MSSGAAIAPGDAAAGARPGWRIDARRAGLGPHARRRRSAGPLSVRSLGALIGVVAFAPAAWLAAWRPATDERLLLGDARGTVWSGSAVAVLTGGPGSRDASALPGRLDWTCRARASVSNCAHARPAA